MDAAAKRTLAIGLALCAALAACRTPGTSGAGAQEARPSDVKDPCDDRDAGVECCFAHMPAALGHVMAIADSSEPGQRLVLSGVIYRADGKEPYPGVLLYAYHTDHTGHYSRRGDEKGFQRWHGHLHGWCRTNAQGQYEIRTIRPARYPANTIPAHIHSAVQEPNGRTYYINDFVFADDDLVNEQYLAKLDGVGGTGVMTLRNDANGVATGVRDIVLDTPSARQ